MNARKTTLLHRLSPVVLVVLMVCVVWLLVDEWHKVRVHRSPSGEAEKSVAARSAPNSEKQTNPSENRADPSNQTASAKAETWPSGARQPSQLVAPMPAQNPQQVERTIRLPDGRELTFGGLTWGVEHKYTHSKPPPKATKTPTVPKSTEPEMRTISIKTTSPSLVAWLHCRSARGSLLQGDFISVVDDKGVEGELSKPNAIFNAAESETVGAWEVANFPRRDASFGIRLYSRDSANKFHRMGQFWAANPAPRQYPVWSPEDLPIIKSHQNTRFRLSNLFPDDPLAPHAPLGIRRESEDGTGQWSTCVFKVWTYSHPPTQWKVESIALSDATGNVSVPDSTRFSRVADFLVFSFNRTFWGSETAGKLRTEFTRLSGFSSNELVTFSRLPVPSANSPMPLDIRKQFGPVTLQLQQLVRHKPPILMDRAYWNMELTAALIPETPGVHVSIVEMTDQTGRTIGPGISHKQATNAQSFLFHSAPGSEILNITFAVQQSQVIEFAAALRNANAINPTTKIPNETGTFQQARVGPPAPR